MDNITSLDGLGTPNNNGARSKQPYYYIWAVVNGRLFVDGGYDSENEAIHFGAQKIRSYFDVEKLNTKDLNRATRIIRHKYLDKTGDLVTTMKRAKHQI